MTPASILDGSYRNKPDLVAARGVIRHVLNENFGFIYGPNNVSESDRTFCLFDTFDLVILFHPKNKQA